MPGRRGTRRRHRVPPDPDRCLIAGPCCALLTGRWRRTALTGAFALSLGVLLGVPAGIFSTYVHYAFLAAIAVVTVTATLSVAYLQRRAM